MSNEIKIEGAEKASQPKSPRKSATPQNISRHYQALARRLGLLADAETPRALGVTSCFSGEGVTTVSANLAIAAASLSPGPVALIDANADRPALHRIFRVRRKPGLENVMAGDTTPFDCLCETALERLSLLPAGRLSHGRQPAYDPASIDEMIDNFKHVFPLTIIDLPPANELSTCFPLVGGLDGIVLVIEAYRVPQERARRACRQLSDANGTVLGVVFNKFRDS
ncbi:MAG: CpsD/CapB family tyrosine-protein kinase [Pirellulales bacterium]